MHDAANWFPHFPVFYRLWVQLAKFPVWELFCSIPYRSTYFASTGVLAESRNCADPERSLLSSGFLRKLLSPPPRFLIVTRPLFLQSFQPPSRSLQPYKPPANPNPDGAGKPRRKSLFRHLTTWVLLAVFAGALLGHFAPETGLKMELLGVKFVSLVKLFINPLIFVTITLGISAMGDLKKVGKVGGKALVYFEVVTTFALLIGIAVAYVVQPGRGIMPPEEAADLSKYAESAEAFSWWLFLKTNLTLQVLLVSLVIGSVLNLSNRKYVVIQWLGKLSKLIFMALHWVMYLAPFGAFGGMAFTVSKYGLAALIPLASLMLTIYLTMAIFVFVVLGGLLRYYRISLLQYLRYISAELLIVLGTSSSESALPAVMEKLERMGCDRSVVGLVVPAGYSFNLDGTTIYLSMATLFLAQVYNIDLTWSQMATIIGVLMVTSKGAAGVTGAGFTVLVSTLSAVKVIPIEGLTLLLGIDRFMSEARSITNFIGNGVAAIALANHEGVFDRAKMDEAFAPDEESA